MFSKFDISVKDTIFDPALPHPTIYVRRQQTDRPLYKVWVFLEGSDLPYVKSATYTLHPTFRNRIRKVNRTLENPNCGFVTWMWGIFVVKVRIEGEHGETYELAHSLRYGEDIRNRKKLNAKIIYS